jgi:hypothetical protein
MKSYFLTDPELTSLRSCILDRATLLPMIQRAVPGIRAAERDELVAELEGRINYEVEQFVGKVSE